MTYCVWIGGIPDYEGKDLKTAKAIYSEWIAKGYEDVILEIIEGV